MYKTKNTFISFNVNKFFRELNKKKRYSDVLLDLDLNFIKNVATRNKNKSTFLISYIIEFSYTRTNTLLCVKNSDGRLLVFFSAGSITKNQKKKDKIDRDVVFKKFIDVLIKLDFLKDNPIALHLVNVDTDYWALVKALKKNFFLKLIKVFTSYPYNGCRQKKLKRKKFSKKH